MSEIANIRGIKKDLGDLLVEKEIISAEQLLFALDKLSQDSHDKRRRLPQVLVEDLHIDHDKVYGEIANYYAFRQLEISQDSIDDEGLAFIRRELNNLPANVKTLAMDNRVLPFAEDPERPGRLLVIT